MWNPFIAALYIALGMANVICLVTIIAAQFPDHAGARTQPDDALRAALQLGRLDAVTAILAGLGLVIVFGGVFSFVHYRNVAREQARETAAKVAERVAKRVLAYGTPDKGQEGQTSSSAPAGAITKPAQVDVTQAQPFDGDEDDDV